MSQSSVVVLLLPDVATARRAADDIHAASSEGRFAAHDMVIVENVGGRMRLHHASAHKPLTSFAGGALLGGLCGVVFGTVVAPALLVGSAAAAATALTERSIPRPALEQIGAALTGGHAALFVLTDPNSAQMIRDETFANSTVPAFDLHPDDETAVAEVADEVVAALGGS